MNQLHIDNTRAAIKIIEAAPEEKFDLKYWRDETHCGTLMCAAGWCAMDPAFQAQGLGFGKAETLGENSLDPNKLSDLFGNGAFRACFKPRYEGDLDMLLITTSPEISDKELALARLNMWLKHLEKQ